MASLSMPPPTMEAISWEFIEQLARDHQIKVTITLERGLDSRSTLSIDHRPDWIRAIASTRIHNKEKS